MSCLTIPERLSNTPTNFDRVNLSLTVEGKIDAKININKLDVEDRTLTMPASVSARAI